MKFVIRNDIFNILEEIRAVSLACSGPVAVYYRWLFCIVFGLLIQKRYFVRVVNRVKAGMGATVVTRKHAGLTP
jgi:hypothetical protein